MIRFLSTTLAVGLMTNTALAGGFAIREQSAEGLGSAFAGMAAGSDGLSAMFWNPATISEHNAQGYISETVASGILPYSQSGAGAGFPNDSGNIGQPAIVPAGYSSYGLTNEITIALAMTSPLGLVTDAQPWKGSPAGDRSEVLTYNVSPMIAFKPIEGVTVALGANGEYMKVHLTNQTPAGVTRADITADNIAFGYTAGILVQPTDTIDIGLSYRSSIHHDLAGSGTFAALGGATVAATAPFDTPDMIDFGIKVKASDQLKLMAGVEWAGWGKFQKLAISAPPLPTVALTTIENWHDSWFFSAGAEYALNEKALIRGGLGYELSPVPDATRTVRAPDNDRVWLSVGGSYKINTWITTDIGYSHVFVNDGPIAALGANFVQHIDLVSASATLDW